MLMIYFLGRLDGRSPHANLLAIFEKELKVMSASDSSRTARRCGSLFAARGEKLIRLGESLSRLGMTQHK